MLALCARHGTRFVADDCEECSEILVSLAEDPDPADTAACIAEMRAEYDADVRRMLGEQ